MPSRNVKNYSAARNQEYELICVVGLDKGRRVASLPGQENTPLLVSEQDKEFYKSRGLFLQPGIHENPWMISYYCTEYPQKMAG